MILIVMSMVIVKVTTWCLKMGFSNLGFSRKMVANS